AEMKTTTLELSKQRMKVAKKLATEAQQHLADLGMPDARMDAALDQITLGDDPAVAEVPALGIDQLELQLAANRGEPARPLRTCASGGELTRARLALKRVRAGNGLVGRWLVFDETDSNVGARHGDFMGEKLEQLGKPPLVIWVRHLPQVACF